MPIDPSELSLPIVRAIAEYTYDWESWIGPDGRLRWVNGAVERISGYSVEACLRMESYPLPLVHEDDRARIEALLRSAASGSVGNDVEFRVVRKDGALRWVAVSWQPIVGDHGEVLGHRASIRDIDERKTMEVRLRALRERAERADRAKTELLAHVSHELRTPADCVMGFAELLLEAELEGPAARYAEVIRSQASLLLRQVEDLLDMASLESGGIRLERRPLDVHALVRRWAVALEPESKRAGARLTVAIEPSAPRACLGDELRLSQVLRNLIENAIRHAGGGAIVVRVAAAAAAEGERLVLEVRDEGVGIAAERLADITLPFVQVEGASARRHGGAGLGLAICDRLVRAMGGAMTVRSELGAGTSVEVVLPLERLADGGPAEGARLRGADQPQGAGAIGAADRAFASRWPLRILVVDDTPESQELLCEQLARLGYEPARASSGREALELASALRPDVMLLDLQMPDLDGATVARRLIAGQRAMPDRARPRLVGITASSFAPALESGLGGAFDALVVKPLTRAQLAALLARVAPEAALAASDDEGEALVDRAVVDDLLVTSGSSAETMLSRYLGRTDAALPALFDEMRARMRDEPAEAGRAAHQALGLLLSIGARAAAEEARELVDALNEPSVDASRVAARLDVLEARWATTRARLMREAGRPAR